MGLFVKGVFCVLVFFCGFFFFDLSFLCCVFCLGFWVLWCVCFCLCRGVCFVSWVLFVVWVLWFVFCCDLVLFSWVVFEMWGVSCWDRVEMSVFAVSLKRGNGTVCC